MLLKCWSLHILLNMVKSAISLDERIFLCFRRLLQKLKIDAKTNSHKGCELYQRNSDKKTKQQHSQGQQKQQKCKNKKQKW